MSKKPQFNERQQAILDALEGDMPEGLRHRAQYLQMKTSAPSEQLYAQQMQNLLSERALKTHTKKRKEML